MGWNYEANYGTGVPIPRNEVRGVLGDEDHDYGDCAGNYDEECIRWPDRVELVGGLHVS